MPSFIIASMLLTQAESILQKKAAVGLVYEILYETLKLVVGTIGLYFIVR